MNDVLNKTTVLVLNRNWQRFMSKRLHRLFCMMATDVATALDIEARRNAPVNGRIGSCCPLREGDNRVRTVHGAVRVPRSSFWRITPRCRNGVPNCQRKISGSATEQRANTRARKLAPHEGNIDHVVPRSRGGKTAWENCVLAHKEINSRKADKLPGEAGLRLRRSQPRRANCRPQFSSATRTACGTGSIF